MVFQHMIKILQCVA